MCLRQIESVWLPVAQRKSKFCGCQKDERPVINLLGSFTAVCKKNMRGFFFKSASLKLHLYIIYLKSHVKTL